MSCTKMVLRPIRYLLSLIGLFTVSTFSNDLYNVRRMEEEEIMKKPSSELQERRVLVACDFPNPCDPNFSCFYNSLHDYYRCVPQNGAFFDSQPINRFSRPLNDGLFVDRQPPRSSSQREPRPPIDRQPPPNSSSRREPRPIDRQPPTRTFDPQVAAVTTTTSKPDTSPTTTKPDTSPTTTKPDTLPTTTSKTPLAYVPGQLTKRENGIDWSTGLSGRRIAATDFHVEGVDGFMENRPPFHKDPDAAACFKNPNGNGWVYVSNSEDLDVGGVGVIRFDNNGGVTDYQKLLINTSYNCGGGKSPWETWLSCEEVPNGRVFETDPFGGTPDQRIPFDSNYGYAHETCLGEGGGPFESVAVDNRNPNSPVFFVTLDARFAELRRYRTDANEVQNHIKSNEKWKILKKPDNGPCSGKLDYLYLTDDSHFTWVEKRFKSNPIERNHLRGLEGIDFKDGKVYFVSKGRKELFILDLDSSTYERSSTIFGSFDEQPDQIRALIDGPDKIIYFCEDGGESCGVHARNSNGDALTIFESCYGKPGCHSVYDSETTGLAFSPDYMHMYVSFQYPGHIYDVTRDDGEPFHDEVLDIKYHATSRG